MALNEEYESFFRVPPEIEAIFKRAMVSHFMRGFNEMHRRQMFINPRQRQEIMGDHAAVAAKEITSIVENWLDSKFR